MTSNIKILDLFTSGIRHALAAAESASASVLKLLSAFLAFVFCAATASALDEIRSPGYRPLPASVHALVGGRVVVRPGEELEKATIIVRDGCIVAVGVDVAVPADARVHDMAGTTIYAGFIDAHVSFAKAGGARTPAAEEEPPTALTAGVGSGFLGVSTLVRGGGEKSLVTPQRRMAREYAPDKKALEALRVEGFTAANVVPDRGSSAARVPSSRSAPAIRPRL